MKKLIIAFIFVTYIFTQLSAQDIESWIKAKQPLLFEKLYLHNINNPKPDYRPTLFWEPDLKFEHGKSNIDFYTSDELADYVVFVEGISKAGKICYGTTSFKVK